MKKTNILFRYLFLIITACLLSCSNDDDSIPVTPDPEGPNIDFEVKPGMDLVGIIYDDSGPISGVVVSDGYTVMTTGNDGIYQMKKNNLAKFVFASIPSDHEIPTAGSLPVIYQKIDHEQKVNLANFKLKAKTKETEHILVAIADPQPSDFYEMERFRFETLVDIQAHIDNIAKNTSVYGIVVGDVVWDRLDFYNLYTKHLNDRLDFPLFQVIGNHDHNQAVIDNDYLASAEFEAAFGPTYYSYNIGDCHYVVLDDIYYTDRVNYRSYITPEQLIWLKEDLKYVSKDKLIILGIHIPTKRRATNTQLENNQDLYSILEGYNVRIISGHAHHNFTATISSTIEENTLGAAMGEFWSGDICGDGSPNGYAIYKIEGNKISDWYYKGTSNDPDYQIKLYPQNTWNCAPTEKNIVAVNIFNWHTNWTVSVTEDGISTPWINPSSTRKYDPLAFDNLYGEKLPLRHPSGEPIMTDHIFYYTPTNTNWNEITVTATTPYGKTYTNKVTKAGFILMKAFVRPI